MPRRLLRAVTCGALVLASWAGLSLAHEDRLAIPRPDGKPADHTREVKVFVLLGQSNMLGFRRVGPKETKGTLEYMVKEKGKYGFLVDAAGKWAVRKDVRYVHVRTSGASTTRTWTSSAT